VKNFQNRLTTDEVMQKPATYFLKYNAYYHKKLRYCEEHSTSIALSW